MAAHGSNDAERGGEPDDVALPPLSESAATIFNVVNSVDTTSSRAAWRQRQWMARVLMLLSAAQQVGASATSLIVLKTLAWSATEIAFFWTTVSIVLWCAPLLGWLSDWWSASPSATAAHRQSDGGGDAVDIAGSARERRADPPPPFDHRRLRLLQAASACGGISFALVWLAVSYTAPVGGGTAVRHMPHLIVSASVLLALVQLFQTATLNGWLVAHSRQHRRDGAAALSLAWSSSFSSAARIHRSPPASSSSSVLLSDVLASVQSWAMLQRSFGSLCGSVLETLLLLTNVVNAPAHLLVLVCVPLQLGCVACIAEMLSQAAYNERPRPIYRVPPPEASSCSSRREVEDEAAEPCGNGSLRDVDGGDASPRGDSGTASHWWRPSPRHVRLVKTLAVPLCFVVLYTSVPSPAAAYYAFVAQRLAFPTWLLAMNGTVGLLASMMAVMCFDKSWRGNNNASAAAPVMLTTTTAAVVVSGNFDNVRDAAGRFHNNDEADNVEDSDQRRRRCCGGDAAVCGLMIEPKLIRAFMLAAIVGALGTLSNLVLVRFGGGGGSHDGGDVSSWTMGTTASQLYLLVDEALIAFVQRWLFMPMLVLAAQAAALVPGLEAFVFELFSAASSFGGVMGGAIGVVLIHATGGGGGGGGGDGNDRGSDADRARVPLTLLIVVCAAWKVLPVLTLVGFTIGRRTLRAMSRLEY